MSKLELFGDWSKFKKTLDPGRFRKALSQHVGLATRQNALHIQDEIKKEIRNGVFEKNSSLTTFLKGSTSPLIESGLMRQQVTQRILSDFEAIVGLMRGARTKKGKDLVNLGLGLHEGYSYKVTDEVRDYFLFLHIQNPDTIKPLKEDTTVIRVKGRPFVLNVVSRQGVITRVEDNWRMAVARSFTV